MIYISFLFNIYVLTPFVLNYYKEFRFCYNLFHYLCHFPCLVDCPQKSEAYSKISFWIKNISFWVGKNTLKLVVSCVVLIIPLPFCSLDWSIRNAVPKQSPVKLEDQWVFLSCCSSRRQRILIVVIYKDFQSRFLSIAFDILKLCTRQWSY